MVTLDKPSSSSFGLFSSRRPRKRNIIRIILFLIVCLCLIKLFPVSIHISFLGTESDSQKSDDSDRNFIRNIDNEREYDRIIARALDPAKPVNVDALPENIKPNPAQEPLQAPVQEPVKAPEKLPEPELIPAFVGQQSQEPIYMENVDRDVPWDKAAEAESIKTWKFNKYLSDRLPLNRDTADGRHKTCSLRRYQKSLPAASVVLVFYNEALSVVLRTALTVLKESDPRLIHEILFYDDCSTNEELKEPLERFIAKYPKMRLVRSKTRGGLVKARLYSSREATGEVLLYLDAHCEPTPGWLEPLLEPIAKNRKAITLPSLDIIKYENLEYIGSDSIYVIGGVNWLMNMLWYPIPEREKKRRELEDPYPITANLRSPTMAGGLFAMNRLYFKEIGEYDEEMGVWGGENMELSFRAWMCGGEMLFVPCSKVGHIFRPSHPYDFMGNVGDVVSKNYVRSARVWFDKELSLYYKLRPQFKDLDVGDISKRLELRERLQCKSYKWFIKNVFPELPLEEDLIGSGQFRTDNNKCMDTRGQDLSSSSELHLSSCTNGVNTNSNRFMMFTKSHQIMGLNFCLDSGYNEAVQFHMCHNKGGTQDFRYEPSTRQIKQNSGKCLTGDETQNKVTMTPCKDDDPTQKWSFEFKY